MVTATEQEIIDIVKEIDTSSYVVTTYQVGDYVLRKSYDEKWTQQSEQVWIMVARALPSSSHDDDTSAHRLRVWKNVYTIRNISLT